MVQVAKRYDSNVQLRDQLFRLAMNAKQAKELQETADQLPDLCQWVPPNDLVAQQIVPGIEKESILGALRLDNGCQVIHVPSYLRALWKLCQEFFESPHNSV